MRTYTGKAIVQVCEHERVVAAHVLAVDDSLGEVLFDFFGLTAADWIENQWRFYVWSSEAVRAAHWCPLHEVAMVGDSQ